MDRRLALAVLLLAAPAVSRADSDAVFASALDLTIADLRHQSLSIEMPVGAPVAAEKVDWRDGDRGRGRGRGGDWDRGPRRDPFPFPFPFPDDRDGRDGRRRGPGRGAGERTCRGYDHGWEEHGGHGGRGYSPREACNSCAQRHGRCDFRCTVEAYVCTAVWEDASGARGRQIEGRRRYDRYDAEDSALDECRDQNWGSRGNGRCRLYDCRQDDELVDSGRCQ